MVGTIKSNVALASGSWLWASVGRLEDGTVAAPGSDYIVRIRDAGNAFGDNGNAGFTIAAGGAQTLQLTAPNGGESWIRGSQHTITWKAENWTGNVQLSLFKGGAYKGIIASSLPSSPGTYVWEKVGTTPQGVSEFGHDYRIAVARAYGTNPTPIRPSRTGAMAISRSA